MQPSKAIQEIVEAAKQQGAPFGDETQVEATIRHLKEVLEMAIETLYACEAVQAEWERQLRQVEDDNDRLAQNLLEDTAQMAVLRRQLAVARQSEVETTFTWRYIETNKLWQEMLSKQNDAAKPKRSHHKRK